MGSLSVPQLFIRAHQVFHKFNDVLQRLSNPTDTPTNPSNISRDVLEDAYERYKLWAGNLGAFHHANDTRSLEHRFRNAPHIRQRTCELLEELLALLSDSLLGEPDQHSPIKSTTAAEDEEEALAAEILGLETSIECQESSLYACITDVVGRLFRVSKLVVKSTTTDRHAKAETARDDRLPDTFDVAHVRDKFGDSGAETWLIERLGKAITKRRQYFLYCRKHRERLDAPNVPIPITAEATELRAAAEPQSRIQPASIVQPPSRIATSRPSNIQTAASTLGPIDLNTVDYGFDDIRSYSTVVTSVCNDAEEHTLRLPKLIDVGLIGGEFECPYCYTLQNFNGERGWQKHAYTDIQPYLCTFKECGLLLFADHKTWADHEMKHHRRYWKCQICSIAVYDSRKLLKKHIKHRHKSMANLDHLDTLLDTCSYALETIAVSECLLCDWRAKLKNNEELTGLQSDDKIMVSTARFMRHLATHLEQLAFFSLPRKGLENVNSAAAEAGVEETSNLSGKISHITHSQGDLSGISHIAQALMYSQSRHVLSTDHITRQHEETAHSITLGRLPWNDKRPKLEDKRVNEQMDTCLQLLDRSEDNVNNESRFYCVFHNNPDPDSFEEHHMPRQFVSSLKYLHAEHGLHYCSNCLSLFRDKEELLEHEFSDCLLFRCLKPSCENYSTFFQETYYCPRGHENSESDIHEYLRKVVHEAKLRSYDIAQDEQDENLESSLKDNGAGRRLLLGESDLGIDEVSGYAGLFHEELDIVTPTVRNNRDSVEIDDRMVSDDSNALVLSHQGVSSRSHLTEMAKGDEDERLYHDPGAPPHDGSLLRNWTQQGEEGHESPIQHALIPPSLPFTDLLQTWHEQDTNDTVKDYGNAMEPPISQRLSNSKTGIPLYLCRDADCQRRFQRKDNMIDHMRRVHNYAYNVVENLSDTEESDQDDENQRKHSPRSQVPNRRKRQENDTYRDELGEGYELSKSMSPTPVAWNTASNSNPTCFTSEPTTADWIKLSSRHPLYGLTGDNSSDQGSNEITDRSHPPTAPVSAATHVDPSPFVEHSDVRHPTTGVNVPLPRAKFKIGDYVSKEVGPNARQTFQIGQASFAAGYWIYILLDTTDGMPWNENRWYPESLLAYEPPPFEHQLPPIRGEIQEKADVGLPPMSQHFALLGQDPSRAGGPDSQIPPTQSESHPVANVGDGESILFTRYLGMSRDGPKLRQLDQNFEKAARHALTGVPSPKAKFERGQCVLSVLIPNMLLRVADACKGTAEWEYKLEHPVNRLPWNQDVWHPESLLTAPGFGSKFKPGDFVFKSADCIGGRRLRVVNVYPSTEHGWEYILDESASTWQAVTPYPEYSLIRGDHSQDKPDATTESTTAQDESQVAQNGDHNSNIISTKPDSKWEGQETAGSSSHPPRSRQHDGGIGCFICGMRFESGMDLSRHQNSVHQDGYPNDDVDFEY